MILPYGELDHVLATINRDLAALLHQSPAELVLGAEATGGDTLVVCGILGGKDVGKSTLINALAGVRVSADEREVGRGTSEPIAYVHEDQQATLADRLASLQLPGALQVRLHQVDTLRDSVLVDLPDFDSEFIDHLAIVEQIAPLLDRVLWLLTPRKIGDRAWVQMFRRVIQDHDNVYCVLNKFDELLKEADALTTPAEATAFAAAQQQWMARSIEDAGWPAQSAHCFLVAAGYPTESAFVARVAELWDDADWSQYAAERTGTGAVARWATAELDRLREAVLSPVSATETARIKRANRRRALAVNAAQLRRHYDLDRLRARLERACEPAYQQDATAEAFGPAFALAVADALELRLSPDAVLADDLLDRRVQAWPLLRLVHWPFGWLSRLVSARLVSTSRRRPDIEETDPARVAGQPLAQRVDLLRARVLSDHADLAEAWQLDADLPAAEALAERSQARLHGLAGELDERLLAAIRARDRRPSVILKLSLWFILLWFPLLQPLTESLLTMLAPGGALDWMLALAQLVRLLGASQLLVGLIAPTVIYVMILASMHVRALRDVRRFRAASDHSAPLPDAVAELIDTEVVDPLFAPFRQRLQQLTALDRRLQALEAETPAPDVRN